MLFLLRFLFLANIFFHTKLMQKIIFVIECLPKATLVERASKNVLTLLPYCFYASSFFALQ